MFVFWADSRTTCDVSGDVSDDPVDTIVYLSSSLPEEVLSWYREDLSDLDFLEYAIPTGKDIRCTGTEKRDYVTFVFLRARVGSFCWNRHARIAPMVTIKPAPQLWRDFGYKTVFEVYRPAL